MDLQYSNNISAGEIERGKTYAAFVYVFFFLPFLNRIFTDNRFVIFHAGQSMLIFTLNVICIGAGILVYFLGLGFYDVLISFVLLVLAFVLSLVFIVNGVMNCFNGELRKLPLIGNLRN